MADGRLSDERLAEIRKRAADWECTMDDPVDLLGHIAAQQAEIDRLGGQVAALREALESVTERKTPRAMMQARCCDTTGPGHRPGCKVSAALADTEAVAKEHDQRLWLAGAREALAKLRSRLAEQVGPDFRHSRIKDSYDADVQDVLHDIEREVGQ